MGGSSISNTYWYLDRYIDGERVPRRVRVSKSPFLIGRRADLDLPVACNTLSGLHAEIRLKNDQIWIEDRKSSNGTFVNRQRIERATQLHDGDLIHLATNEFVVGRVPERDLNGSDDPTTQFVLINEALLPRLSVPGIAHLRELLVTRAVTAVFQPIVTPDCTKTPYFELLGRGVHPKLSSAPYELFRVAAEIDAEAQLSRTFRKVGFALARKLPAPLGLFLNVHPTELRGEHATELLDFLAERRALYPEVALVVEVHESAVLDREQLKIMRSQLLDLDVKLAYDDFGAGQARLLELADVPCDFLKFDMSMIRAIDQAPRARQLLIESLVRIACDLGIKCLAEGIETAGEWETCQQLGFTYAQGYHFGWPAPADHWVTEKALTDCPA